MKSNGGNVILLAVGTFSIICTYSRLTSLEHGSPKYVLFANNVHVGFPEQYLFTTATDEFEWQLPFTKEPQAPFGNP